MRTRFLVVTALLACVLGVGVPTLPALAASAADIGFSSADVKATVEVHQAPGGGCGSGFTFQAAWGGCVRASTESESSSRACPAGQTGTQRRSRTRTHYSHQNGQVQSGAWSGWSALSGTCTSVPTTPTEPTGPTAPKPGVEFPIPASISAMICGASDAGYATGGNTLIQNTYRDQLIGYYRNFGLAGRCPETRGYGYWLSDWWERASAAANGPFHAPGGNPGGLGWGAFVNGHMQDSWPPIKRAIDASASGNDEAGQGGVNAANGLCQLAADAKFGKGKTSATYVLKSGNRCRITAVF